MKKCLIQKTKAIGKFSLLTLFLVTGLSSTTWAAASSSMRSSGAFDDSASDPIVQAIYQASNVFYNLINPSQITLTLSDYNGAVSTGTPAPSLETLTGKAVSDFIVDYLGAIPDSALVTDSSKGVDVKNIKKRILNRDLQNRFLFLLRGSDSVYLNTARYYGDKTYGRPKNLSDGMFLMSTLINPTDYTQMQFQEAKWFVDLFTQSYVSPAEGLDFKEFKEALLDASSEDQKEIITTLMNDSQYQDYIRSVRSNTAMNSVIYGNLFYLISERRSPRLNDEPFPLSLVKKNTIAPPKPNEAPTLKNSSRLAVQSYHSNKAERPGWMANLSTAAPGDVQKSILLELAEIHHALYQEHLDNERIIATLTSQLANTKAAMSLQMQRLAEDANKAIENAANVAKKDKDDDEDEDENNNSQSNDDEGESKKSSKSKKKSKHKE